MNGDIHLETNNIISMLTQEEKTSMLKELQAYVDQVVNAKMAVFEATELKEEIGSAIKEHLQIDVEGYYEPYSRQREHHHKAKIYWD